MNAVTRPNVPKKHWARLVLAENVGHHHVHEDNVRVQLATQARGFRAAAGLAYQFDILNGEKQELEPATPNLAVVHL
jgi:hypothetical protein